MPQQQPVRDFSLVYTLVGTLMLLIVGFALTWFYLQHREQKQWETHYLTLPPVAISRDGHSMAATIAVRTSAADAGWVAGNKHKLQQIAQGVLMEADPQRMQAPGGLLALQASMRDAINAMLQSTSVQEILLTDFLLSEGDL
jgi:flagellar basal body-associated protein FliL